MSSNQAGDERTIHVRSRLSSVFMSAYAGDFCTFLLIFVLALAPRLIVAISSTELPSKDALGYDLRAQSIAAGQGFSAGGRPTSFKEPLYSFFLAAIYLIFGNSYVAVRAVQSIMGAFSCYIVYLLGKRSFGAAVGFVAAMAAAFDPSLVKSAEHTTSEGFFTFLLLISLYLLLRLEAEPKRSISSGAGAILGLAALTRSVVFFFPFLIAARGLIKVLREKAMVRKAALDIAALVLPFLLIIAPWTVRNWWVHRSFVPISTNVGINLYSSYRPPQGKLFGFNAFDENTRRAFQLGTEVEQSRYLMAKTFESIRDNPGALPYLIFLKSAYFFSPFDWEVIGGGVLNFVYFFSIPFFVAGLIAGRGRGEGASCLYLALIYFFAMAILTYGSPRFRLPVEPLLLIFAALGLVCLFRRSKRKLVDSATVLGYFGLSLFLYFYSSQVKAASKMAFKIFGLW